LFGLIEATSKASGLASVDGGCACANATMTRPAASEPIAGFIV
jgi:hypothetical protein